MSFRVEEKYNVSQNKIFYLKKWLFKNRIYKIFPNRKISSLYLDNEIHQMYHESIDLLKTVELKWIAISVGFEKIILKNDKLICQFISDKEHNYYSSGNFQKTLKTILQNKKMCEVKEKKNKDGDILIVVFKGVNSIDKAINNLKVF